jgi:hypothetical protein
VKLFKHLDGAAIGTVSFAAGITFQEIYMTFGLLVMITGWAYTIWKWRKEYKDTYNLKKKGYQDGAT